MQFVVPSAALAARPVVNKAEAAAFSTIDAARLSTYTTDMLDALATHCRVARVGRDGARYVKVATTVAGRLIDEAVADVARATTVKAAWSVLAGAV